ncbi:MAG: CHAT domain-containing tetratricopeptide repeat protein [Bacteroidota bacterium]
MKILIDIFNGFHLKKKGTLFFWSFFAVFLSVGIKANVRANDSLITKCSSHIFNDKSVAYQCFENLYKQSIRAKDYETAILCLQYINYISGYYYDLQRYKSTLDRTDSLFGVLKGFLDSIPDGDGYRISHKYDKGNYYFKTHDYDKSREMFNAIIAALKDKAHELPDYSKLELAQAYNFLATMYHDEKKYALAKAFYFKNLRIISNEFNEVDKERVQSTNNLLAAVYSAEGNYEKANSYLSKSLEFYLKNRTESRFKNNRVTTLFLMAQNYQHLQKMDSAQICLELSKEMLSEKDAFLPEFYQLTAEIHQRNEDFELALAFFQKQFELSEKKRIDRARVLDKMGQLYVHFDQPKAALPYYQRALGALAKNFSGVDAAIYEHPNPSQVQYPAEFIALLRNKGVALNRLQTVPGYESSLQATQIAVTILDSLRTSFRSDEDKLALIEDSFLVFDTGMEAAFQLYDKTGDSKYLEKAFFISEKSKGNLLMEAMLNARATAFANLPKAILEKEKQYKSKISFLERLLRADAGNHILQDRLFQTKLDYRLVLDSLESTYPEYYDLKYDTHVTDLSTIQKVLKADQMALTYFYGENAIYAMAISKTDVEFKRILRNTVLDDKLIRLVRQLGDNRSDLLQLQELSLELYPLFLPPLAMGGGYSQLIVVPDGLLSYVPFGSFRTSDTTYLIAKTAVSHVNSLTLWTTLRQKTYANSEPLVFAPTFIGKSDGQSIVRAPELLPLPHNRTEAAYVLSHFNGALFEGVEGTLHNFLEKNNQYGIVHLATHAVVDDETPEYSYLAFTNAGENDFLLFVNDLYNLSVQANLVTLSACETGIGNLRKGEGMLSLTRAFFFAGASSIVNSLWKINDNSTAILMDDFYKYLAAGHSKDIALRKAKLTFLDNNAENNLSHPYYWSGIVLNGNTAPLETRYSPKAWFYILFLVFALAVIVWYRYKH